MYDEYTHLELENRIKNLMWTVSEDYALDVEPDIRSFSKSKYISLYDAVKQGAFAKYFDVDTFGMYLLKKVYLGAEEGPLVNIAQLCIDSAVWRRVSEERIGVPDIRIHAFSDILEYDFHKMTATLVGQVKIAILRDAVTGHHSGEQRLRKYTDIIHSLEDAETTMEIICAADTLYNIMIDPDFEKMHGDLQKVLSVTTSELRDSNWQDLLDEDVQSQLEQMQRQMMNAANRMNEEEEEKERRAGGVIYLDEESIAKMYSYIELNYGRSYLNEQEQKRINHKVCRGPHADCSLFFTDGILSNMVKVNSQSEYAKRTKEVNLRVLSQHRRVTMRNIAIMTDILKGLSSSAMMKNSEAPNTALLCQINCGASAVPRIRNFSPG